MHRPEMNKVGFFLLGAALCGLTEDLLGRWTKVRAVVPVGCCSDLFSCLLAGADTVLTTLRENLLPLMQGSPSGKRHICHLITGAISHRHWRSMSKR